MVAVNLTHNRTVFRADSDGGCSYYKTVPTNPYPRHEHRRVLTTRLS